MAFTTKGVVRRSHKFISMPWVWSFCVLAPPSRSLWAWIWQDSLATGDPIVDSHLRPDGYFDFVLLPRARNARIGMMRDGH